MKIGRMLIAGISVTAFNTFVGMVCCGHVFSWVYTVEPTNVWKSITCPPNIDYFIGAFALNLSLVFAYLLLYKGMPVKNNISKGLLFGFIVFLVGTLPGMYAIWSFMTVATPVVIFWTVQGFIADPLKGAIIASIYGD